MRAILSISCFFIFLYKKLESANLRTLRAKDVRTCQRALHIYMFTCQRAFPAHTLTCQLALHAYVLTCQRILRLYVLMWQRALHA